VLDILKFFIAPGATVTSTNITNVNNNKDLLDLLRQAINNVQLIGIPDEDKANLNDDLEIIIEQVSSGSPKKTRILKALEGIKKFMSELSMKLAVTQAASAVTGFDWHALIKSIELFVCNL
jgi:endonuclease III